MRRKLLQRDDDEKSLFSTQCGARQQLVESRVDFDSAHVVRDAMTKVTTASRYNGMMSTLS